MTLPPGPTPDPADEPTGGEVLEITPLDQPPDAVVEVPGSKSLTNRALLCAALARGRTRLEGVLFADDTEAMMGVVAALGATLEADRTRRRVVVEGLGGPPRPRPGTRLDARMSGTTGRFVLPVAATANTGIVVDGHPQLRARPLAPLVDALTDLGATVSALEEPGRLPLSVRGPLTGSRVRLPADVSSQFVSGLLLAGPLLAGGLTVELTTEPVSAPYLDLTVATM
ncbi:MAG: 3-phosphoshikimate 1-carboxyvinyltransferase, partial [Actinomyces sp.]